MVTVVAMYVLCIASDEWRELWNKKSAHEYMDILETADVLEQICNGFAGISDHSLHSHTMTSFLL